MKKPFEEMTKGEQFLRLLRVEYEEQLRFATYFRNTILYGLDTYLYSEEERQNKEQELKFLGMDIKYAEEALKFLGGAENDESVTEPKNSETPTTDKFTGITCTTV